MIVCPINSSTPACEKRGMKHPPPTSSILEMAEGGEEVEDEKGAGGTLAEEVWREEEDDKERAEAILIITPVVDVTGIKIEIWLNKSVLWGFCWCREGKRCQVVAYAVT